MRIWVTGDLHGRRPQRPRGRFDAIICPGDVGGDAAGKHMFAAMRQGMPWYELVGKKEATRLVRASIAHGRKVLEYLNSFGVPVYIVPGNWDWTGDDGSALAIERADSWSRMLRGLRNVHDVDMRSMDAGAVRIVGYGRSCGPELPQYADDRARYTRSELWARKRAYARVLRDMAKLFARSRAPAILLTHNVPFGTPIDKIVNPASPRNGRHYGSLVARDLIRKHAPAVAIGGHMHEHHATHRMGKTIALNTGFGPRAGAIIEISGKKMKISLNGRS